MLECGSRTGFERNAKRRQQQFRDTSPTISDEGRSPRTTRGYETLICWPLDTRPKTSFRESVARMVPSTFFSQRHIGWRKSARSGDDSSSSGPTRNMASSQVACVNFLLPLAGIPGGLLSFLRAIDDDVEEVVDICHEGHTSPVEFEWIGLGRSLEGGATRGSQNTSIDAFMVAETRTGGRRAYLLEWKYVEQYLRTRPEYKGSGTSGETCRLRYSKLYHDSYSSFSPDTAPDLDDFLYEPFYQLMRQRLLGDRMIQEHELGIDAAKVVVVVPEDNWVYRVICDRNAVTSPPLALCWPQHETVEAVMRASFSDPAAQFAMVAPSTLLNTVVQYLPTETFEWASYWRERYGV